MTLAKMASNFSFFMGRFTLPHAISSCTAGVSTMNLSLALRPVYFPVFTTSAPVADRVPSPRRRACSVSWAGVRLRYTAAVLTMPSCSNP